jgi:hypothetical protein
MAPKGVVVTRNIMVSTQWDDIEGKARPYVKMEQNLLDAPRAMLASRAGQMPRLNHQHAGVANLKFASIPYGRIGLYKSAERARLQESRKHSNTRRGRRRTRCRR